MKFFEKLAQLALLIDVLNGIADLLERFIGLIP